MIRFLTILFLLTVGSWLLFTEKKLLLSYVENTVQFVIKNSGNTDNQNKFLTDTTQIYNTKILSQNDFASLLESEIIQLRNKFDQRLFKVRSVEWISRDPEIEVEKLRTVKAFQIDPKSSLMLEVEVFSQSDDQDKTIIAQFSFTDLNTKNKVHEFSRMFKTIGKKKPD